MTHRILMPVDMNEARALNQARTVADLPNSNAEVSVKILFVFRPDSDIPDQWDQLESVERLASVRRAREFFEEEGIDVTVREESGDAVEDILETAAEMDADSIVMGGRKQSPAGKVLFGSVTQSVILESKRPVVVTGG
jgi:nucleotide-binding universal stress UspA family protein